MNLWLQASITSALYESTPSSKSNQMTNTLSGAGLTAICEVISANLLASFSPM